MYIGSALIWAAEVSLNCMGMGSCNSLQDLLLRLRKVADDGISVLPSGHLPEVQGGNRVLELMHGLIDDP